VSSLYHQHRDEIICTLKLKLGDVVYGYTITIDPKSLDVKIHKDSDKTNEYRVNVINYDVVELLANIAILTGDVPLPPHLPISSKTPAQQQWLGPITPMLTPLLDEIYSLLADGAKFEDPPVYKQDNGRIECYLPLKLGDVGYAYTVEILPKQLHLQTSKFTYKNSEYHVDAIDYGALESLARISMMVQE
jgi:hypothetical protein